MIVYPEGAFYSQVKVEDVDKIVNLHLKEGTVVRELLYEETLGEDGSVKPLSGTAFYKKQNRVALRNCGRINPECIEEYIAFDGYQALRKVLFEMTPDDVVNTIKASGLRGRGGGGFPTGMKWDFTKRAVGDKKFVACNADEGDPGAFMDRSVLEGDPHCLIEAMAIAAYAVGSDQGYVYIRAEYPIAVERLQKAIEAARKYGFLGNNIFGTDFSFDMEIRLGAGAFVCGEETASRDTAASPARVLPSPQTRGCSASRRFSITWRLTRTCARLS